MAFLSSMDISTSGLTAQRLRMDTIAQNIASATVTRTANGGPYRRRFVTMAQGAGDTFGLALNNALSQTGGLGVRVQTIEEDPSPFKLDYNPDHPDANEDGYVEMPNVETVREMVDMMAAYRAYEANITALNTYKNMAMQALQIGR